MARTLYDEQEPPLKHIDNFKSQLDKLTLAIEADDVETMEKMMLESTKRYLDLHSLNEK